MGLKFNFNKKRVKLLATFAAASLATVPFQNCSKGFKSSSSNPVSSSSSSSTSSGGSSSSSGTTITATVPSTTTGTATTASGNTTTVTMTTTTSGSTTTTVTTTTPTGTTTTAVLSSSGSGPIKVLRLSNYEYKNSLTDALTYQASRQGSTTVATSALALSTVTDLLTTLPLDTSTKRLGSDQLGTDGMSSGRFTAYVNIAYALAGGLTSSSTNLKAFVGSCATTNTDVSNATCLNTFITNFGSLAFRNPPTSSEITELKSGITSWTDLIGRILIHPRFLTHYERGGTKNSDGSYQLSAYEVEARLAYVFWKSIPDISGLAAAANGSVLTSSGLQTEIKRYLASSKAKDTLWRFYQQYLAAQRVPVSFDAGAGFTLFASPLAMSAINATTYRDAILQDANDFLSYITWTSNGKLEDIFRSKNIFTMNSTLAGIYGVTARTSSSDAPKVDASGNFAGILTRAIITNQKPGTFGVGNHVQRGVLLTQNIMGIELGLPANFAEQQALASTIPATASSVVVAKTLTSPSSCMACHSTINPPGFALANYDSLGRYITSERVISVSTAGAASVLATNTVDPNSTVTLNGVTYTINSAQTLVDAMVNSGVLYQGFTKYYFRYAFSRIEDTTYDKSMLDKFATDLKSASIVDALTNVALHPDFMKARPAN